MSRGASTTAGGVATGLCSIGRTSGLEPSHGTGGAGTTGPGGAETTGAVFPPPGDPPLRPSANFSLNRGLAAAAGGGPPMGGYPAGVGLAGPVGAVAADGGLADTGVRLIESGWNPAHAGTRRAPNAVPANRSRRFIPDLA